MQAPCLGCAICVVFNGTAVVDHVGAGAAESHKTHLTLQRIGAVGHTEQSHIHDVAHQELGEVTKQDGLGRSSHDRHVLINDDLATQQAIWCAAGVAGFVARHKDGAALRVFDLAKRFQCAVMHHPASTIAVSRVDRVLQIHQIVVRHGQRLTRSARLAHGGLGYYAVGLAGASANNVVFILNAAEA